MTFIEFRELFSRADPYLPIIDRHALEQRLVPVQDDVDHLRRNLASRIPLNRAMKSPPPGLGRASEPQFVRLDGEAPCQDLGICMGSAADLAV